jgi:uracil phosphoribosyltransferase
MFILAKQNTIASHYLAEIRDKHIQNDSMRFRTNMKRIGEIMAYEISKSLEYESIQVTTPLGSKECSIILHQPVLLTVLRAGLPFFEGFQSFFDKSSSGFFGAYRKNEGGFEDIEIEGNYFTNPDLSNQDIIITDPMLATGKSFAKLIKRIKGEYTPKSIHIACVIASRQGLEYIESEFPDCKVWAADVDDQLNDLAYIVPGLGDAGDLSFGKKVTTK